MEKRTNTDFFIKVSTGYNLYNIDTAAFKASLLNESTGTITAITNQFSEVINTVAAVSTTVATSIVDSKTFDLSDSTGISDGDVLKINNTFYYIKELIGTTVTVLDAITADAGDVVDLVGNTGIYKVKANIATAGEYTAFINNPVINMQNHSLSLSLVDASSADISTQLDLIKDEIIRSSFI